jgi:L-lysine exporter family protein LysE/ArgO
VFVFNQGATQPKFYKALPVILTAALCDTLLISLAVLGVSVLLLASIWIQTVVLGVGILFLIYMGWSIWHSSSQPSQDEAVAMSTGKQISFAASVSLLNPHAIMDTIGVIGTNALQYKGVEKWVFALACIAVSWLWFFGLALAGRWIGKLDSNGTIIRNLNKISALIIWGVAIYLLWRILLQVALF